MHGVISELPLNHCALRGSGGTNKRICFENIRQSRATRASTATPQLPDSKRQNNNNDPEWHFNSVQSRLDPSSTTRPARATLFLQNENIFHPTHHDARDPNLHPHDLQGGSADTKELEWSENRANKHAQPNQTGQ